MVWALLAIPAFMWAVLRLTLPNQRWDFDWDAQHATFTLMLGHYMKLVGGMAAADLWLAVHASKVGLSVGVIDTCVAGAAYSIAFLAYLLTTYERYLHSRYLRDGSVGLSVYTTAQYALVRTLGYSSLLFTVCGGLWTLIR